ncbi:LOW QUALITY PROTEIN: ABC transporter, permease protein [Bacillus sp. JCM 19045]|nr:LOW QUALITY PROTEIN: ABC transporter, permease protein [Bacillus sp. JCM 19045]
MNNFWTIVGHTASSRLKTKSFVISTIITMVLIIGIVNIGTIIDLFSGDDEGSTQNIAVVDESDGATEIAEALAAPPEDEEAYIYQLINQPLDTVIEEARDGEYDGVVQLTGTTETLNATFYGENNGMAMDVQQEVQRLKEGYMTSELDIDEAQLAAVYQPIGFEQMSLEDGEATESAGMGIEANITVFAVAYVLFFIIITYSTMIATEVATEKSSRVMELIVSSVNPIVQMFAKLTGIGLTAFINIVTILVAGIIGIYVGGNTISDFLSSDFIDIPLIGYGLIVLFLGYFLFGGIAAMLGALVSRTEDVQQAVQPLIYLAMIGFFIVTFGMSNAEAAFVKVASYIPFFTPQLIVLRIGSGTIEVWEIALLLVILAISAVIVNLVAARVYKGGVLMHGKFSFKNGIKQALVLSKKEK